MVWDFGRAKEDSGVVERLCWFSYQLKGFVSARIFYSDNGILYMPNTLKKPLKSKETTNQPTAFSFWNTNGVEVLSQPLWWLPSKLLILAKAHNHFSNYAPRFQTFPEHPAKQIVLGIDSGLLRNVSLKPCVHVEGDDTRSELLTSRWPFLWGSSSLSGLARDFAPIQLESGKNMNR